MASSDNVNIVTRERPASQDINNLQAMIQRNLLEIFQYGLSSNLFVLGAPGTSSPTSTVLGGLEVIPNGNNVSVQPGALMMYSSSLAPTPGTLDSSYRLGTKRIATTVVMPSPVSTSYVVVEARVLNVVTSVESRDVMDATTGIFAATSVNKLQERQLEYQATAVGVGTIPAYTGGDWVPIAIVRRPGGGGAVGNTDIYDVRPLFMGRAARGNESFTGSTSRAGRKGPVSWFTSTTSGTLSENIKINDANAYATNGERLWFCSNAAFNPSAFGEASFGVSANTWYYLYLAPFRGSPIRNSVPAAAAGLIQSNCLLILSAQVPNFSGLNAGTITPDAPYGAAAVTAGTAVCIGAIRRNSANSGWVAQRTDDGCLFKMSGPNGTATLIPQAVTYSLTPILNGANLIPGSSYAPASCKAAIYQCEWLGGAGAPAAKYVYVTPQGVTMEVDHTWTVDDGSLALNTKHIFEVPCEAFNSLNFTIQVTPSVPNAASVLNVVLVGFRY